VTKHAPFPAIYIGKQFAANIPMLCYGQTGVVHPIPSLIRKDGVTLKFVPDGTTEVHHVRSDEVYTYGR